MTRKFHSVALFQIEIEIISFSTDIVTPKKLTEPSGNVVSDQFKPYISEGGNSTSQVKPSSMNP